MNRLLSNRRQRRKSMAEINVVPYIDVMLVLLVIFMVTAPLLTQGVNVNLPQAAAKALVQNETPMIVSVDGAGRYFLNASAHPNEPLSPEELMIDVAAHLQVAAQAHKTLPIYVKGDRDVNYGKVVQAMVLLQRAGAQNVGLITAPEPQ